MIYYQINQKSVKGVDVSERLMTYPRLVVTFESKNNPGTKDLISEFILPQIILRIYFTVIISFWKHELKEMFKHSARLALLFPRGLTLECLRSEFWFWIIWKLKFRPSSYLSSNLNRTM